ncbi:MAG: 3-mercaptopyruvate sulfurtransferase [Azospirillum sp.]|nr:3-mercaptopyruvate sulfurtransferase [Azospirillum sp.]
MSQSCPNALVCSEWLKVHLAQPDLRLIDGTYLMPGSGRDAHAEYAAWHIPGAVFFDIDEISDKTSSLPHMLPDAGTFAAKVGALGIGNDSRVVIYDSHGMMSAARVWWMFRAFGHRAVAVLDGGLPKWRAEGHPVTAEPTIPRPVSFSASLNPALYRSATAVLANITSRAEQLVDARAAGRFDGSVEDPWPGRRRGHVPGSLNLPYTDLLDPASKTFLPADQLAARIAAAGIDRSRPVIASCGSGVTACVVALALELAGTAAPVAVYDGSWAEWGLPDPGRPVESGAAVTVNQPR